MKRFIEGECRTQTTLFPECLDDYVVDDNPVKFVEAFIDGLDLGKLGFHGVDPQVTGRPAYHPSTMLKIYVYGYLNRIHSSRRLERETRRNIELMWLIGRLTPDFKTIANFRKHNGKGIRRVCCEFIGICRKMNLFTQALVAIDGSKFKAVNNRDRNFTRAKMKRRLEDIERSIERYFSRLDKADQQESPGTETTGLQDRIVVLKAEMQRLREIEAEMLETPAKQISLTDSDARSMKTRGAGIVGYNVQTAVDVEHHLIVAHEVTNVGSDRGQLSGIAKQAQAAMQVEDLEAVADRGYYKSEDIMACDKAGIKAVVPKSFTSNNKAYGLFDKQDFRYVPKSNEYICPAGERLTWRTTTYERENKLYRYWTSKCGACAIKSKCTTGTERRVTRWEHEEILEAMQDRLDRDPGLMRLRRDTAEHPFGTIKGWMGSTHFLTKTIEHVSTEMSLHVLAYNLKRVMNILGVESLIGAIRAIFIAIFVYVGCYQRCSTAVGA